MIRPRFLFSRHAARRFVGGAGGLFTGLVMLGGWSGVPGRLAAAEPAAATAEAGGESDARVRQLLWDAQQKRDAGQTTEALADLRAANAVIKKAKGASHPDTLRVLDMAGAILF